jgi:hypothetical protein
MTPEEFIDKWRRIVGRRSFDPIRLATCAAVG